MRGSLFNKVAGQRPVNFEKFVGTPFLQNTSRQLLLRMSHLFSTSWNGWVISLDRMFLFYKHIEIPQLGLRQPNPRLKIC